MQEFSPVEEQQKYKLISDEHAKQLHWEDSLKIEKNQMELFIKQSKIEEAKLEEEARKVEMNFNKAQRELSLSHDEAHLRGVVQEMCNSVAADTDVKTVLLSVARTLNEFLSK